MAVMHQYVLKLTIYATTIVAIYCEPEISYWHHIYRNTIFTTIFNVRLFSLYYAGSDIL